MPENAGSAHAERMSQGDGAAVDVDLFRIEAQLLDHGQRLCRERLVQLDQVELVHRERGLLQRLVRGGHRTHPHLAWVDACARCCHDASQRGEPELRRLAGGGEENRRGPIVEAATVARRHRAAFAKGGLELRQLLQRRVRARSFVKVDRRRLLPRHGHRQQLGTVPSRLAGGQRALVRSQREFVLLLPRDAILRRHVLGGLAHALQREPLRHPRIGEAPAEGGVVALERSGREPLSWLHQRPRRPRHALHAAGDAQLHVAEADGARRLHCRLQPTGAEAIDGHARHVLGKAGEEQRHAGDVAVVLACLVGASEEHLVDRCGRYTRVALEQLFDDVRAEIVRPHRG